MGRSEYDKKNDVIGKLWERTGGKGPYMTGMVYDPDTEKEINVVIFPNNKREGEEGKKDPDWRILKSKPREPRDERQARQEREREEW